MKNTRRLVLTAVLLALGGGAFAEAPVWTYKPGGEPSSNWGMVEFADGGQTFQLVHLSFIAAAREGKVGFKSKVPGYDVALPMYTVAPEEEPQLKGGKYLTRCQTALTPYRLHLAIKTEGGKKKITKMTVLREDNPSFAYEMNADAAPSNIAKMLGGDPATGTYKGKPLWVTVRLPTIDSWRDVVFTDGANNMTLWFFTASFKRAARGLVADFKSPDPNYDAVLPLLKMTSLGTAADSSGEKTTWTMFQSEATPYKLFLKLDAKRKSLVKLTVKKGDTLVQDVPIEGANARSLQNIGLLIGGTGESDQVGGKTALIEVKAAPTGAGLSEYELGLVALMDADARAKAKDACKGEASAATTGGPLTDCWRTKVKDFLKAQRDRLAAPGAVKPTEFDPFELAYVEKRLGAEDFKKFKDQFTKAQKAGRALEFVKAWRERISKEVEAYLNSGPGTVFKPKEQLESIEKLLVACDSAAMAESLKFCGNGAWGDASGGDAVIPGTGGRKAQDLNKVPGGDRRVSLAMKEPPAIGADKGPAAKEKDDKNKNVNMLTGVKLGLYTGTLAFLVGGFVLGPFVFLAAIFGMLLGWWMATDINR